MRRAFSVRGGGGGSATYIYNPSKPPFTAINRRDCLRASAKVASDLCTRLLKQLIREAYNSKEKIGALPLFGGGKATTYT